MLFDRLNFRAKFILAFSAIVAVFGSASIIVYWNLGLIESATERTDQSAKVMHMTGEAGQIMLDASGVVRGFLLTRDPAFEATYKNDREEFRTMIKALKASLKGGALAAEADRISQAGEGYFSEAGDPEIKFGADEATLPQALAVIRAGVNKKWMDEFKDAVARLDKAETDVTSERSLERTQAIDTARRLLIGASVAAILVAIGLGFLLIKTIGVPVKGLTAAMQKLASGDSGVEVPSLGRRDEIGQMAATVLTFKEAAIEKIKLAEDAARNRQIADDQRSQGEETRAKAVAEQSRVVKSIAEGLERLSNGDLVFRITEPFFADYEKLRVDFNSAVEKLQQTMIVVANNAAAIRTGSDEITAAADDLARRTEQQAAGLEETAAALNQITSTVRKTAEGANNARDVVGTAKSDAERSGEVVRRAVETMSGIEKSSGQIGQIISVIDEIAFQTNLLALNAGVEAARAGEAGRGFAVVASEVRALAQRSAEAAKEIKALISASVTQVEEGVQLVAETGKTLKRIIAHVMEINEIVVRIATSAQEQAVELGQVNAAVSEMDKVTQQNAAMVEESGSASHSLAQETERLSQLIGKFRVGDAKAIVARTEKGQGQPARLAVGSTPVATLKTVGPGGAARSPRPASDDWSDF